MIAFCMFVWDMLQISDPVCLVMEVIAWIDNPLPVPVYNVDIRVFHDVYTFLSDYLTDLYTGYLEQKQKLSKIVPSGVGTQDLQIFTLMLYQLS